MRDLKTLSRLRAEFIFYSINHETLNGFVDIFFVCEPLLTMDPAVRVEDGILSHAWHALDGLAKKLAQSYQQGAADQDGKGHSVMQPVNGKLDKFH